MNVFIVLDVIKLKNLILNFFIRSIEGIYGISDKFPFTITGLTKS